MNTKQLKRDLETKRADLSEKKQAFSKKYATYLTQIDKTKADLKLAKTKKLTKTEAELTQKLNYLLSRQDWDRTDAFAYYTMERQVEEADNAVKLVEEAIKTYAEELELGKEYFWHSCFEAMEAGKKLF